MGMYIERDTQLIAFLDSNFDSQEYGLLYGKAGLALYYARKSTIDKMYTHVYNMLIDDLFANASRNTAIEFPRGILGIAFAVDLILEFYKKGNPDYVLDDIDALIYRSLDLNYKQTVETGMAAEGLFYMVLHLKYGIRGKYKKEIFAHKAAELLEYTYSGITDKGFRESVPINIFTTEFFFLYSVATLAELGYYKDRLTHICNELIYILYSCMPVQQFNRLVRLFTVVRIQSAVSGLGSLWNRYTALLRDQIDEDSLVNIDCKTNQLALSDGLTGVFLMMEQVNKYGLVRPFCYSWAYYKERVEKSELWNNLQTDSMPMYALGLNGLWGIHWCIENKCQSKVITKA